MALDNPVSRSPYQRLGRMVEFGGEEGRIALDALLVLARYEPTQRHAFSEIASLGLAASSAVPDLLDFVSETSQYMKVQGFTTQRCQALHVISNTRSCQDWVITRVIEFRDDPNLRAGIASVLVNCPSLPNSAIPALVDLVREDPRVVTALGDYSDPSVVEALQGVLREPWFPSDALESLGRIGKDARAAAPLVRQYLESPYKKRRRDAAIALFLLTGEESLPDEIKDVEREAARLLTKHWRFRKARLKAKWQNPIEKVYVYRESSGVIRIAPIVPDELCSEVESRNSVEQKVRPLVDDLRSRGFNVEPGCHPQSHVDHLYMTEPTNNGLSRSHRSPS